ncbi:MAG: hypothetical protein U0401_13860 [Anaerolineae bacterium]
MTEYTDLKEPEMWTKVNVAGSNSNGYVNKEALAVDGNGEQDAGYLEGEVNLDNIVDNGPVDFGLQAIGEYEPTAAPAAPGRGGRSGHAGVSPTQYAGGCQNCRGWFGSGAAFTSPTPRATSRNWASTLSLSPSRAAMRCCLPSPPTRCRPPGASSAPGLFNAIARGIDVKIIGDKGHNVPGKSYFDIVLRADLKDEVKEIKDLKGRKIVLFSLQSVNEEYAVRFIEAGGWTKDDVELAGGFGASDMVAALTNGSAADAAKRSNHRLRLRSKTGGGSLAGLDRGDR